MIECASCKKYASVAQSVEQLIRNQQVVCSSHIASSKKACNLKDYRLFAFPGDVALRAGYTQNAPDAVFIQKAQKPPEKM